MMESTDYIPAPAVLEPSPVPDKQPSEPPGHATMLAKALANGYKPARQVVEPVRSPEEQEVAAAVSREHLSAAERKRQRRQERNLRLTGKP